MKAGKPHSSLRSVYIRPRNKEERQRLPYVVWLGLTESYSTSTQYVPAQQSSSARHVSPPRTSAGFTAGLSWVGTQLIPGMHSPPLPSHHQFALKRHVMSVIALTTQPEMSPYSSRAAALSLHQRSTAACRAGLPSKVPGGSDGGSGGDGGDGGDGSGGAGA